ncbi:hypothetical protein, partial [Psychromonas sp. SP041]|uniref:hypothetical protein n=1 Tax=Psychromonas sp. SP041 TaxID=1365007 RepID=UPI001981C245
MEEQNNLVNENNDTEVELTNEQLTQAEEQLNLSGEQLNSTDKQLSPLVDDGEVKADSVKENASTPVEPGDVNAEIDIDDLDAILALGEEVFDLDIETAAGEESDGGFSLVDFERDGEETIAKTNFQTIGLEDETTPVDFTDEGENLSAINTNDTIETNDTPILTLISSNNFTEDNGNAVEGAEVATFETNDEDGDTVTVTLSDTENYAIVGNTVVLTDVG